MSDLRSLRVRRLRSDAVRSRSSLVDAAIRILAVAPEADLARVATAAGLSRQTLYAHFGSRAGLLDAVVERIMAEVTRLLDEARLHEGSALDALFRFIGLFDELPDAWIGVAVTATTRASATETARLHAPVLAALTDVVRRGQADGEFAADLPIAWLAEATMALGHAAFELESSGTVTRQQARAMLRVSLTRLYGAQTPPSSSAR